MECIEQLAEPARAFGVDLCSQAIERLSAFVTLLVKWNTAYNLTGTRVPDEIATRHVLDSLTGCSRLYGDRVIDVGTGAGFPGMPMAICNLDKEFVLLDANTKKTRFLRAVKSELQLTNVQVVTQRLEDHSNRYSTVISRALGKVPAIVQTIPRLAEPGGRIVVMAGRIPEQIELHDDVELEEICSVIPDKERENHHLICLRKLY